MYPISSMIRRIYDGCKELLNTIGILFLYVILKFLPQNFWNTLEEEMVEAEPIVYT